LPQTRQLQAVAQKESEAVVDVVERSNRVTMAPF